MKIMFVGDINLGEYYPSFGHGPRSFLEKQNVFDAVQPIFDQADFVVGNLEAAITHHTLDTNVAEKNVLRGDPKHSHVLKDAGFKLLQVANNHTVQHSFQGFEETLDILESHGIVPVGLNNEAVISIEKNGLKIGFLAASDVPDNTFSDQKHYQVLDESFIEKVTSEVANYDHLIVLLHWGLESSTKPLPYQRELADRLYKAGVSAIVGSHPHLFYEIEKRENFIAAYSLGNFVFDLCWDKRMLKSGILCLDFGPETVKAELWPIELLKNGCLPSPSGDPVFIETTHTQYNLGDDMAWQQSKKILYLILHWFQGSTYLKLVFFAHKIMNTLKPKNI